ncbi:RNA-binding protein (RRM superfamily) [Trachipleistophora hominis]|uniref:RNA-binding protein (RRM superfamily) n=1 Tax=Trachipleistophora hominis TaxID=72359 RepID=L7JVL2_TRAHO|nr:RNA-binding protein (RRM superfamily) [Trachipleistophora hominis]
MRLVVKNLPPKITENDIKAIFREYGTLTDVFLLRRNASLNKGVCFIGYSKEEYAKEAIKQRHGSYIENRKIIVEMVRDDKLKRLKMELKKIGSGSNPEEEDVSVEVKSKSLYLTKLPVIVSKEDIVNYFSDCNIKNIEMVLDEKTGNFYGHAIVTMDDIESAKRAIRQKDVLLGRRIQISFYNEPPSKKEYYSKLFFNFESVVESICSEEKITKKELLDLKDENLGTRISLIETHLVEQTRRFLENNNINLDNLTGKVNKKVLIVRNSNLLSLNFRNCNVKVAPSKCLALLEFRSEEDAKKVYDELQYKRVKDKAIYVDFLPISKIERKELEFTNKLIIKNVPFQANKEEIKRILTTQVKLKDIRLPKKRDGMHKGYCFVTLNSPEDAKIVYQYFGNNTHLYGRRLVIEPAQE